MAAAVMRGGASSAAAAAAPWMPCPCSSTGAGAGGGGGSFAWEAGCYNSNVGSTALLTARSSSSLPLMGAARTRFGPVFRAWRGSSSLELQRVARNSAELVEGHCKAGQFVQDAPQFNVARIWTGRIEGTNLGKVLTSIAASAGLYLQDAASALEEVVKVEDPPDDLLAIVATSGFYAFLYFLVIPAIVYNYLRLRWYKRNAAETFFQFMLVFVFFPGMLLLAPFINFRRLPKEGTEPP